MIFLRKCAAHSKTRGSHAHTRNRERDDVAKSAREREREMASAFRQFINFPTGPKTTHFWGPVANWGFVLAVSFFFFFFFLAKQHLTH